MQREAILITKTEQYHFPVILLKPVFGIQVGGLTV